MRRKLLLFLAAVVALGIGQVARGQMPGTGLPTTQGQPVIQYGVPSVMPQAVPGIAPAPVPGVAPYVLPQAAPGMAPAPASASLGTPVITQADVSKAVADALKKQDDDKKAAEAAAKQQQEAEGYKVGTNLNMTASWQNGFIASTPNKDFTLHIGGWLQFDNVFWSQSPDTRLAADGRPGAKQGVASGVSLGGIGDMEDGVYFRRIRLQTDGVFYETYEYTLTLAFENNQFSTVGLDEFWVGAKNVPLLGTVRLGHVKNAIGIEADMSGSSKVMTFMERSAYSESIELNQNFVTGIWLGNNYLDERTTWSFVAFRPDNGASSGVYFGDGQYGLQGRLTALPIWEEDGRCFTHVGLSGGWRNGTTNLATSPLHQFQIRARPELRDDDPAGNPAGGQPVPNANDARLIDTGVAVANNEWLMGLESLSVWGPLSVQAEYGFNWLEDVTGFAPAGLKLTPTLASPHNYAFNGGYLQLAYTITGENRAYDKRLGRLNSFYFGPQGLYNNAWFVRDDAGHYNFNFGAWEIAARYSYVNLNDGTALNTVQGGVLNGYTIGLNWYLNNNAKLQFDYVYDQRSDLPAGVVAGNTRGLGMRMQFNY